MPTRKQQNPCGKVGLNFTAVERKVISVEIMSIDREYEEVLRNTPTSEPIMLTLDQWDDLGGYIAAEANHAFKKMRQRKLDAIVSRIEKLLSSHSDEDSSSELKIFRPQEE
jgi:hypothetical protein